MSGTQPTYDREPWSAANTLHKGSRWLGRFNDLRGTDWSPRAVQELKDELMTGAHFPVIDYLVTAFQEDVIEQDEDKLHAVILACGEHHGDRWTPGQFMKMAHSLMGTFDSWETAIDTWLAKAGPTLKVEWLKTDHPDLRKAIQGKDQLWVEVPGKRVVVFYLR